MFFVCVVYCPSWSQSLQIVMIIRTSWITGEWFLFVPFVANISNQDAGTIQLWVILNFDAYPNRWQSFWFLLHPTLMKPLTMFIILKTHNKIIVWLVVWNMLFLFHPLTRMKLKFECFFSNGLFETTAPRNSWSIGGFRLGSTQHGSQKNSSAAKKCSKHHKMKWCKIWTKRGMHKTSSEWFKLRCLFWIGHSQINMSGLS